MKAQKQSGHKVRVYKEINKTVIGMITVLILSVQVNAYVIRNESRRDIQVQQITDEKSHLEDDTISPGVERPISSVYNGHMYHSIMMKNDDQTMTEVARVRLYKNPCTSTVVMTELRPSDEPQRVRAEYTFRGEIYRMSCDSDSPMHRRWHWKEESDPSVTIIILNIS